MTNNQERIQDIQTKNDKLREGFKKWTSYFRANPHRFASEYLGLNLKLFQKILLYLMSHVSYFMYIAARGQGKSWLIAVYAVIRCILYPSSQIVIASGTKGQAKLIVTQKIMKDFMNNNPNIRREIREVKNNNNECIVYFHNGSSIEAVTSTDNSRGYRGNILILDEFRLIKPDMIKRVLRMFLTTPRQPAYLKNPKYEHLTEENQEIYISSAWYKNHWMWDKLQSFKKAMAEGKDYFVCGLNYKLSVYHGLLSKKRVEEMMTEEDYDPISWLMEMDCLFFGESEHAWFKLNPIDQCRDVIKAFYPLDTFTYISNKNKRKKSTKQEGEIRVLGVDVAMMGGSENDNTIFTLIRLLPNGDEYEYSIPYLEHINGQHSQKQAIRLKQLYSDLEADYVVMDTAGNGLNLYDDCCRVLYDSDRDEEYPAWCAMNDENMKDRALDKSALPIVFSIKAGAESNHEMAMMTRALFEKKKIKLLVNEIDGKDHLTDKHNYLEIDGEQKANLILPYIQTTMLVNEMINLEYEINNGKVKVYETGRNRKDRYSSLGYGIYYSVKVLEARLKEKKKKISIASCVFYN